MHMGGAIQGSSFHKMTYVEKLAKLAYRIIQGICIVYGVLFVISILSVIG